MRSLIYLLRTILKNMLMQMIRKPALLIVYVLFFGMMIFAVIGSGSSDRRLIDDPRGIFAAVMFGLFFVMSYFSVSKGFKQGSTFFSMSDVNFIFTAPLRPQTVLVYGIIRQMGMSALMTLFMCFQIPNLINFFGLSAQGIFAVLSGWFILVLSIQASTLCLYSLTAPFPSRRTAGKYILNGLAALLILGLLSFLVLNGGNITALFDFFYLPAIDFFPFAGWIWAYIRYFIAGDYLRAILFLLPAIVAPAVGLIFVRRTESDYYEDVLQITETVHAARSAMREGKRAANVNLADVKTGKSGLVGKGTGASAFFFRHLTEQRRSGLYLVDKMSVIVIVIAAIAGIILRSIIAQGKVDTFVAEIIGVTGLSYILFFMSVMGKFNAELSKPYIYLIPSSNVAKLFYSNLASVLKSLVEGLAAFLVFGILTGTPWWYVPLAALLYAAMSQIYISMTILTQRILGDIKSKLMNSLVYLLSGSILLVPGLAIFIGLLFAFHEFAPSLLFLAYIAGIIYAAITSTLVLFLGQGVLQSGDV